MKFKYMCSEYTNPYYNMALEEYLFRFANSGEAILFLWQNEHTIVIGKNQNIIEEMNFEAFVESGGCIARRKSGGGAVYHGQGNLNYSIISKVADRKLCSYQNIVINTLKLFGVEAYYNGRNDIIVNDRKVSGNAVYNNTDIVCQHGTLLISEKLHFLNKYLTPDKSKLVRNGVKSVDARVENLSEFCEGINIETMKDMLIKVTKAEPLNEVIDISELESLMELYKNEIWIMGGHK